MDSIDNQNEERTVDDVNEPTAKKPKISSPTEDSLADIELAVLKIKTEKLEKLVGKLKAEKEHFMNECDAQLIQLSEFEEIIAKNEEEKAEAKTEINSLNLAIKNSEAKVKTLKEENQNLQKKIKELNDEILSIKTIKSETKDTVEEERETAQATIKKLKKENQNLMNEKEGFQAVIDQLKDEISELKNNITKPPKVKEKAPKLSAEEQATVDDEANVLHLSRGARVFAIWGNKYYPAIIDGYDVETSRYKVIYAEDQSIRNISKDGIIPLWMIKNGTQIYVEEKNEYEEKFVFKGKILGIPSIENNKEWHRGIYKIEIQNREFPIPVSRDFKWSDIFFTYTQFKQIIKAAKTASTSSNQEPGRRALSSPAATPSSSAASSATPEPQRRPAKKAKENSHSGESDLEDYI